MMTTTLHTAALLAVAMLGAAAAAAAHAQVPDEPRPAASVVLVHGASWMAPAGAVSMTNSPPAAIGWRSSKTR